MATLAPPSDYEDDAGRIDAEYIPDSATTEAEVQQALEDAGFPEDAQSHIEDWLVTEEDAWDVVGPEVQDADSVRRAIDRESGGTVSETRARSMADDIGDTIREARGEAASRVTDSGQIITESGGFGPSLQNAEEVIREDGVYYRGTEGSSNPGKEYKGASFDR